jgi:hypothetical protein
MLFNKENRLSASIFGHVLNSPLYDGDCSPAAREYLAAGDIDSAIGEWRRLADLGSGRARCILAYLSFKGTPLSAADIDEAKRIALTAVAGERGYANYLLGSISLKERQVDAAAKYFVESVKAGFLPAFIAAASILLRSSGASKERKQNAIDLIRRAISGGHIPARIALSAAYISGKVGLAKRALGFGLFPLALVRYLVGARYHVFSIHYFQIVPNSKFSLFNAESIARIKHRGPRTNDRSRLASLGLINAAAALVAAVVVLSRPDFTLREYETHTGWAIAGWILLAAWPYGLSYLMASVIAVGGGTARVVHVSLLILITALTCDAYSGRLFGIASNGWMLMGISLAQAFLLLMAGGFGALAAQRITRTEEPVPPYRNRVLWAHLILGFVAAIAIFTRPEVWHLQFMQHSGIDVVTRATIATLPYGASAVFSWPLSTTRIWRSWIYIGVLILATMVVVGYYSGAFGWSAEFYVQGDLVLAQFIGFFLAAEWALDGDEW